MPYIAEKAQVTYGEEAYSSYGVAATSRARSLGIVQGIDVPGPENELKEIYAIGAGRGVQQVAIGAQKNDGLAVNILPQDMRWLAHFLGKVVDNGTDVGGGGGSTLSSATAIGAVTVTVASATGYAVNDYIEIDVGTNAEIRKITVVVTNTLTLDEPLRRVHASGAACNEVMTPFTHIITGGDLMVGGKNQFSQTIEVGYASVGAADFALQFLGCMGDSCEISIDAEDMLKASLTYHASQAGKQVTLQTVSLASTGPYLYSTGELQWNAVAVARVKSVKCSVNNNGAVKRYIRSTLGRFGYEYIPGKRALGVSGEMIMDDATILDDFLAATERTIQLMFTRGANDTLTIAGTLVPKKFAASVPESGEIPASFEGVLKSMTVTVVDSTDHY